MCNSSSLWVGVHPVRSLTGVYSLIQALGQKRSKGMRATFLRQEGQANRTQDLVQALKALMSLKHLNTSSFDALKSVLIVPHHSLL